MEYTKGEWGVVDRWNILVGERLIANCGGYASNTESVVEENEANAQLIAAAPDMYEALKDIVNQAEATHLPLGADLADSIKVFGKQALAKAGVK